MFKIRLRYLLIIPFVILVSMLAAWMSTLELSTHSTSFVTHKPNLPAGYYLVLETKANNLPQGTTYKIVAQKTYIGPLSTITECHKARVAINPIYPGIAYHLVKFDTTNQE